MYLRIFEVGDIYKINQYKEVDLLAADDGYMDIIDITDPTSPKLYREGKWENIETLAQTQER